MERAYPNVTALFGRVGIDGELDLIANLDCVVAMDSLVMHMASLVATPVVSVWGATHPGLGFFGYGCDPRGILQADMECRALFGLREQAVPLRGLPLPVCRDARHDWRSGWPKWSVNRFAVDMQTALRIRGAVFFCDVCGGGCAGHLFRTAPLFPRTGDDAVWYGAFARHGRSGGCRWGG